MIGFKVIERVEHAACRKQTTAETKAIGMRLMQQEIAQLVAVLAARLAEPTHETTQQ